MKTIGKTGFALLALLVASTGWGQGVFLKYGPQPGIQFSTGLDYHNTAATPLQVAGVFCASSTTNFLRADGTCAAPGSSGGTVTSVAQTVPAGFAVTGSPITGAGTLAISFDVGQTAKSFLATPTGTTGALSLRTIALGDLPTITVASGGTGLATLPAHGVLLGEGTSNIGNVAAMAADTLLQGQGTGTDPAAVAVNNCGSSTQALSYSTSTHAFGCQTISTGGTGTVTNVATGTGLTGGPITSTGTIALDLTAANTWTGVQTFNQLPNFVAGFIGSASTNSAQEGVLTNSSTGVLAQVGYQLINNLGTDFNISLLGGNYTGAAPCGNCLGTGDTVTIRAGGSGGAISIATVNSERIRVGNTGTITINTPTSGTSLVVSALAGSNGLKITGSTTTGNSFGQEIDAGTNGSDSALSIFNQGVTSTLFRVFGNGAITMPGLAASSAATTGTVCWTSGGNLTVDTTVACLASTRKVKQNIVPLDVGLAEIMKLQPVSYELKPEFDPGHLGRQVGLIAEDVASVDSRLVAMGDDGPRGVRYMQLTAVLAKAIQQQQQEIRALTLVVLLLCVWCGYLIRRGRPPCLTQI